MILAPTSGPIGIQPHGHVAAMINKHSAALAIGDTVMNSFAHTNVVYPPASSDPQSITNLRNSMFSCVVLADGEGASTQNHGYMGVVVGLGSANGASGTEVLVQFGGIARAVVVAGASTGAIAIGDKLCLSDTAGRLASQGGTAGGTAPDTAVAIALEAIAVNTTATINVLMFNGPLDGRPADVA